MKKTIKAILWTIGILCLCLAFGYLWAINPSIGIRKDHVGVTVDFGKLPLLGMKHNFLTEIEILDEAGNSVWRAKPKNLLSILISKLRLQVGENDPCPEYIQSTH